MSSHELGWESWRGRELVRGEARAEKEGADGAVRHHEEILRRQQQRVATTAAGEN